MPDPDPESLGPRNTTIYIFVKVAGNADHTRNNKSLLIWILFQKGIQATSLCTGVNFCYDFKF